MSNNNCFVRVTLLNLFKYESPLSQMDFASMARCKSVWISIFAFQMYQTVII